MSHCIRAAYQYRAELAVIAAAIYRALALPQDSRSAGTAASAADQGRRDYERAGGSHVGRGKARQATPELVRGADTVSNLGISYDAQLFGSECTGDVGFERDGTGAGPRPTTFAAGTAEERL